MEWWLSERVFKLGKSGNLIKVIIAGVVAVVRYSAGMVGWTVKKLKGMDITTRKRMTLAGAFHLRRNLYQKGERWKRIYRSRRLCWGRGGKFGMLCRNG